MITIINTSLALLSIINSPTLTMIFVSKKELFDWAFERACPKGYVLSTKRSSTHALTGEYTKISIWCDRSGKYVPKGTQQRKTGSKKCDCPFLLKGTYIKILAGWKLEVVNHEHNHEPSENLEGHAMAMRFNDEEVGNVRQMKNQKIRPRHILTEIKKNNPKNLSSKRTLYNILAKIKGEETIGNTPMQVFFSLLAKGGYIYYDRTSPGTNRVDGVFFVHKHSYKLWRAFPHFLGIDATYNTNVYKFPYVQMVGVTSTGISFLVASAFISQERQEDFTWMLERLKETIGDHRLEPNMARRRQRARPDTEPDDGPLLLDPHPFLNHPRNTDDRRKLWKFLDRPIHRTRVIDWDLIDTVRERQRVTGYIGEEGASGFPRLFEMGAHPSYRELCLEFLSTFSFNPIRYGSQDQVVHESISFRLCGQAHRMTVGHWAVQVLRIYDQADIDVAWWHGEIHSELRPLATWWPHVARGEYGFQNAAHPRRTNRASALFDPLHRYLHRCHYKKKLKFPTKITDQNTLVGNYDTLATKYQQQFKSDFSDQFTTNFR
ncbi:hypothetical protein SSX86_029741 [Deinandra increscens subsp. villosa]|uniref:MULE transposase domain-containing protein n=1 Tax=Deinandra increscens subsp. villosa TaxID=3103831 RepID=A0AAP0CAQ2_9ASTR